jgi:hypothetical protein
VSRRAAVVAYPDETLPLGYIAFDDLLKARLRRLDKERRRERLLGRRLRRRPTTSE